VRLKLSRTKRIISSLPKYIIILVFATISLTPLVWVWSSAFKTHMEIFTNPFALPSQPHVENLVKAWNVGRFSRYMVNSIIITIPTTIGVVILSSLAGYAFGKLKFYGRDTLFYIFLLGLALPFQAVMIYLYYLIKDLGMISTYQGVILPAIGYGLPFGIFLMRAFFRDLPAELMDAARIDGCSEFQVFQKVMLPLAYPAVTTLTVFQAVWSWNEFLMPLLFLQDRQMYPLTVGMYFFKSEYTIDYALLFAGATIMTLPMVCVYLIFNRSFMKGLTVGAIK